jgi:cobalt-precorrin 5A hydrolase/precorrin-3B C17-methyltransferase
MIGYMNSPCHLVILSPCHLVMSQPVTPVYPIFLHNLQGKLVVVVGGGQVGERKITGLLATNAHIRLISPDATAQLQALATAGQVEWLTRPYQPGDLQGAYLAFAATDQRAVNAQVAQDAHALGTLCNVADAPDEGDFHVPAVHRQSELTIAVGTGGSSPTRARQVRDQIANLLAQENGRLRD